MVDRHDRFFMAILVYQMVDPKNKPKISRILRNHWGMLGMHGNAVLLAAKWIGMGVLYKLYHKHVKHHPSLAKHGQTMSNQRNPCDIRVGGFEEIHVIKPQRDPWYKSIGCTTAQRGSFSRYSSMPVISPDEVGDFCAKSQGRWGDDFFICVLSISTFHLNFYSWMINVYWNVLNRIVNS